MGYDFRAARDEIMKTTRIYRALKAKGMLIPEVAENLKGRVIELEQEISEANKKLTAMPGSQFENRKINFTHPIIPEIAGLIKG